MLANFFRKTPFDWIRSENPEKVRNQLEREIDRTGCTNVIMSSEALYGANRINFVKTYFSRFEVTVVVFLRRQDEWLESAYQEQLKNGATQKNPLDYLKSQTTSLNYAAKLDTWADVFGSENICVRTFERSASPQPMEQVFFEAIGAPWADTLKIPEVRNERLNRDCIAFLSAMSETRRLGPKFAKIKTHLSEHSRANPDPSELKYFLSPAIRRELVDAHAEGNARIARQFLGDEDGQLFKSPPPDPNDAWEAYAGLSAERAVETAEHLADRLYAETRSAG